jgi:hypothetical protein
MDDADVRYIVEQAVQEVRLDLTNKIDRLSNEIAKLHRRITELDEESVL